MKNYQKQKKESKIHFAAQKQIEFFFLFQRSLGQTLHSPFKYLLLSEHCSNANSASQKTCKRKDKTNFFFAPAAFFEMVVYRCHFKEAFSTCFLKICNLNHNGRNFNQINKTNNNNKQRHLQHISCRCNESSKCQ